MTSLIRLIHVRYTGYVTVLDHQQVRLLQEPLIILFRHNTLSRSPTLNIEIWDVFHHTDNELPRPEAVQG